MSTQPIHAASHPSQRSEVVIPADSRRLRGEIALPPGASGIVLVVHSSGCAYGCAQNRYLEQRMSEARLGTLALDLLDEDEARDRHNVFDVELQAERLVEATRWLARRADTAFLPVGYFGWSTGAGAALLAAAREPARVSAIVSGGGRPDMALYWLPRVKAPTLLVVGERDRDIIEWNEEAYVCMKRGAKRLLVVPNAGDLFEDVRGLEALAGHASAWFGRHLSGNPAGRRAAQEVAAA